MDLTGDIAWNGGEPVVISAQEANESCQKLLELFHIKSLAILPVYVDKAWWGMVWFCDCLSDRKWAEVELDALGTASAMIGSAIVQERMKVQLTESRQKTESMYSMMRTSLRYSS